MVVASSARQLAYAANNAGYRSLVIDLYADLDTQSFSYAWIKIPTLSLDDLAEAVNFFMLRYGVEQAVYGSGFEYHSESLAFLSTQLTLWGNTPAVFAKAVDKRYFFTQLEQLEIPYPPVAFCVPSDGEQWLIKPYHGVGGAGISYADDYKNIDAKYYYWQQYKSGTVHSVLFLADGKQMKVVGFNRQWVINADDQQPFLFAGIINATELPHEQRKKIIVWLRKLVAVIGLHGLNSLDFIYNDQQKLSWVLEINPRISASMQLYASDLLQQHIDASHNLIIVDNFESYNRPLVFSAYQIVYAPHDVKIPEKFCWPKACMDIPVAGVICRKGQPICSIIAHHYQSSTVLEQLQLIQQTIIEQLQTGFNPYGISSEC